MQSEIYFESLRLAWEKGFAAIAYRINDFLEKQQKTVLDRVDVSELHPIPSESLEQIRAQYLSAVSCVRSLVDSLPKEEKIWAIDEEIWTIGWLNGPEQPFVMIGSQSSSPLASIVDGYLETFSKLSPPRNWKSHIINGVEAHRHAWQASYSKSLAFVFPKNKGNPNDPRDKWIYNQCCARTPYDKIVRLLKEKHSNWDQIVSFQGVKAAAKRYAERKKLPPIPNRQAGRPNVD